MIKLKKNSNDILALKNKLQQKEYVINENERGLSFNRGFFYYMDQSNLVYECKSSSFDTTTTTTATATTTTTTTTATKISTWKSTCIFSGNMIAVGNAKGNLPDLKNDDRMNVYLSGNHFQQNVAGIPNSSNVSNLYCIYKLDQIASNRDDTFTMQNALFGAMQITKMLILVNMTTKDMAYVLMKEVSLVIQ